MGQGKRDDSMEQRAYILRMFDRWMKDAWDSNMIIINVLAVLRA